MVVRSGCFSAASRCCAQVLAVEMSSRLNFIRVPITKVMMFQGRIAVDAIKFLTFTFHGCKNFYCVYGNFHSKHRE